MTNDDEIPTSTSLGRSFMATNGRTKTTVDLLAIESIVRPARVGLREREQLTFERHRIISQMSERLSIAEVSATFGLPLLSSQVLVSEMVNEGLLLVEASAGAAVDLRVLNEIRSKIASL